MNKPKLKNDELPVSLFSTESGDVICLNHVVMVKWDGTMAPENLMVFFQEGPHIKLLHDEGVKLIKKLIGFHIYRAQTT